jgi:hypothetical protein
LAAGGVNKKHGSSGIRSTCTGQETHKWDSVEFIINGKVCVTWRYLEGIMRGTGSNSGWPVDWLELGALIHGWLGPPEFRLGGTAGMKSKFNA